VWRASSYNPVFDNAYKYKLMSSSANLRMGVASGASDGAPVQQVSDTGGALQQFYITQVTTSQWKIINVSTGKAVTNRSGSTVSLNAYNGNSTDNWAIDDHNGHFKIVNKSTGLALQSPGSSNGAWLNTSTYTGASSQDWDVYAMDAAY
jgi:Ricin-type beta-trefoil lectin domain-like